MKDYQDFDLNYIPNHFIISSESITKFKELDEYGDETPFWGFTYQFKEYSVTKTGYRTYHEMYEDCEYVRNSFHKLYEEHNGSLLRENDKVFGSQERK